MCLGHICKSWKFLWSFLWHIYGLSSVCLGRSLEINLHTFQPSHSSLLMSNFLPSSSVQFSSVAHMCPTLCDPKDRNTPGLPVFHPFPEFTQTHVHRVGDAIKPSHPLLSPSSPAFSLSQIKVFSNESALCIRWPNYWSFSFNISPSNEHSGLISFRLDWDLLAVQRTLKHPFSNTTVQKHQFFSTQLSL